VLRFNVLLLCVKVLVQDLLTQDSYMKSKPRKTELLPGLSAHSATLCSLPPRRHDFHHHRHKPQFHRSFGAPQSKAKTEEVKIGSSEPHPQLLDASPSAKADQRLQLTPTPIDYCLACLAGCRSTRRRHRCMGQAQLLSPGQQQTCISVRILGDAPTIDLSFDDKDFLTSSASCRRGLTLQLDQ